MSTEAEAVQTEAQVAQVELEYRRETQEQGNGR
jgi:hypothetical protein